MNAFYNLEIRIKHSITNFRSLFGSSIPIAFCPRIIKIRAKTALNERAISFARPITLADFVPAYGSNLYKVTTRS